MPIYEYQCESCGKKHEIVQRYTDMPLTKCPECGGTMRKLISSTSFILKGTGWYKTDYATTGGGGKADKLAKGNGAKPEKKPESKPQPKLEPTPKS
ncbi:MAG: zinc ribbon domain-containing protein [Nitrospirae bacterium]|nr:zinc ribbon domain-containing protein [Nitrospirota bacterium]